MLEEVEMKPKTPLFTDLNYSAQRAAFKNVTWVLSETKITPPSLESSQVEKIFMAPENSTMEFEFNENNLPAMYEASIL